MDDLVVRLVDADDVGVPQFREAGAEAPEVGDERPQIGVGGIAGGRRPEIGDRGHLEAGLLLRGVADATRPAREVAPDHVAVAPEQQGGVPEERGPQPVPADQVPASTARID
ncbi:hypothetical protein OG339_07080 [Streptosporangium sp. NBC_01495]|nr:hypothetical protein [Streptosporangium sp. NBC_01495]